MSSRNREHLLAAKNDQLFRLISSRKRKLRELYHVAESGLQLPQISFTHDVPPTSAAEAHFLEAADILKERSFNLSLLPQRQQLKVDTSKSRSPSRKSDANERTLDASRQAKTSSRDGSKSRNSRASTPSSRIDNAAILNGGDGAEKGVLMQRSSSKGSQTDLPAEPPVLLDRIVDETFQNATKPRPSVSVATLPADDLESDRIRRKVQSRSNSPGVDPRRAMPISAEDAANLKEPLIQGLGSHDGQHRAAVAHLPPKEVQEEHIREADAARRLKEARLSIHPPIHETSRHHEAPSSPGSTIDPYSATTPAMHEASADTSPENDSSRYDMERGDGKGDDLPTPPELRHTASELDAKAQHDRILHAQIEASRDKIMRESPREADSESSDTPGRIDASGDTRMDDGASETGRSRSGELTKEATEVVKEVREVEQESAAVSNSDIPKGVTAEIADSEAETTPPSDPMDVDNRTVKDSFDSNSTVDVQPVVPAAQKLNEVMSRGVAPANSCTSTTPPVRQTPPSQAAPVMEGRTTRIGSGAMGRRSVAEIIGDVPKASSSATSARGDSDSARNTSSRSATPQSPGARRSLVDKAKSLKQSKLSTVIFPGRTPKAQVPTPARAQNGMPTSVDDYFIPLFLATSGAEKRGGPRLDSLLSTAHKTITTANAYVPILENQTTKILKRIYALQDANKWSLRQPKRSEEVIRQTTHWDVLLGEVKWLRTDFRQERKWRMTAARNMANACAEWFASDADDRKLLQVKAIRPPLHIEGAKDVIMTDSSSQAGHSTPDLIASGDSPMEDLDEEPRLDLLETVAPTAIFGLQDDDIIFGLRRSPTTDKLLNELPMYGAPLKVPESLFPTSEIDPDRFWKRPALALSKFVEGRLELKGEPAPRKKRRFHYELDEEDDDHIVFGEQTTKPSVLPSSKSDVALFDPQHKHIRDRIHSAHQFRPPSEFPMPPQTFYENRSSSQWTWDEDNELKNLVREHSYNWGLISNMLTSKSLYSSGPERRTPWECFERWVQTEGMPVEMGRTQYFRMYTNRIDSANRTVMAQQPAIPQQPNTNGQVQAPPRKRPTTSIRVDRRRNQKHLTLVDAMRKLAKKREANAQKQQHAAGMAAMRKSHETPNPPNRPTQGTTPQDFSRMKHEREEQMKERMIMLQQRQEQQRRVAEIQRRNAQNPQAAPANGVAPRPPNGAGMPPNGIPASNQNLAVPGQNRPPPRQMPPQMTGQPIPNGYRGPMPMNGVPAAPMQGQLPLPNPALDVGLVSRAQQISLSQQAMIRQQHGQHPGQSPQMHNSPPRTNGVPQTGFPIQNMMPPFNQNGNNVGTPPSNPHAQSPGPGQAGSPRMGQNPMNMLPGNNNAVRNHLEQQILQKYPHATQEQVMRLLGESIAKSAQQQQQQQRQGIAQSAMNAAAGGPAVNPMAGNNPMAVNGMGTGQGTPTPQLYAQRLRLQQESQHKAQQAQMQAANAAGNGQPQAQGNSIGNSGPSHSHRASPSSAPNGN